MTTSQAQQSPPLTARALDIELLALDLTSCTRCVRSLANIEAAIETVRQVLDVTGTTVQLRKVIIGSEEEARRHQFVSSPTIRMSGRDIAFEALESRCDSCTDLCGCTEGTSCRVWRYHGADHTEAPVGLIVEAILRELAGPPEAMPSAVAGVGYTVPANLRDFFAGKAAKAAAAGDSCCSPSEQTTCCEPAAKSACCGEAEPAACGCR
jgi:hypothetical protein